MRALVAGAVGTVALVSYLLASFPPAGGTESGSRGVTLYSALDQRVTAALVEAFSARAGLGAEVLAIASAGTIAARIEAERAHPRADLFVGGAADFHVPLAAQGLLLPYHSRVFPESGIAPAFLDVEGHWHGFYLSTLSIIVNQKRSLARVEADGPGEPRTWDDLLDPAYRGRLAMPSPVTTEAGYVFLATQVFRLGEERAFDYVKQLAASAVQITPTVPLAVQLVVGGTAVVATNWSHEALAARDRNGGLAVIFPPETGFQVGSVSIIKGGPDLEAAKVFVDFLLSKAGQELMARKYLRQPTRRDATPAAGTPALGDLRLVDYDREWASQNKARLRERWQAEIESMARGHE